MITFVLLFFPNSLLLPNSGTDSYIEILGEIQKSLAYTPETLTSIIPKLEYTIKNNEPVSELDRSAFFCLKHALTDFRTLEKLKNQNNKQYDIVIQNLNFMRYPDFLNRICSANPGTQKSLILEFEKNKNNLRLFFNKGSFLEFACLKTLISIRAEELILDKANRITNSEEIERACLPFEECGWGNNVFFCIFKNLAETSPVSLIPCDDFYKKKVDKLKDLLKKRYPQTPTHSLVIFYREMHYFKTQKNTRK